MTDLRLVAYAPNGAKLGPLPTPTEASASIPLNDMGAVSLSYPPTGARTDILGQPLEIAVEVSFNQGLTWAEPPSGRFLYLRDGRDPVKDDAYSVECPAYLTRLEKALVPSTGLDEEGKRTFTDATPGTILRTLLDEAQARGALTGMSWTFSGTNDAAGVPWPASSRQTVSYDVGTSLLAILLGLAEAALVDFRTNGRALEVFVADHANGMGADRTVGTNPVTLRYGRDLTEAPFRRTWEALADTALVQGDAGTYITRTNGAALKPWGRQETFITANGVTDTGTLNVLADAHLTLTAEERAEYTVGLDFAQAAHLPLRDYAPGEWVNRAKEDGSLERVRVRQITLALDSTGRSSGNAVLNDRFLEQDVRTQRRIASVTGGSSAATPGTPSPVGNDILAPAKPLGLDHTTSAYVDRRVPQAQVTLSWLAVTTNADGTPIGDLDHYEIWRRYVPDGPTAWNHVATVQADRTTWSDSPYAPGSQWEYRVRAVDNVFNWSAFSDPEPVTMATDITAPPAPSAPVLGTRNGMMEAYWDGKTDTGSAMPGDVQRVEVHRSQTGGFVPEVGDVDTLVSTLAGAGTSLVSSLLAPDSTWYVRLLAVDYAGNVSAPSAQDSLAVDPISVQEPDPAPTSSPTPNVTPLGVGALMVNWAEAPFATDYDVYVSAAALGLPLSPSDKYGTTTGTGFSISRLPGGGGLVPGTTYYVRVVARNDSGQAAPSAQATGTPRVADSGDISPSYVYTGGVSASQIQTGELSAALALVGGLTAGDPDGKRIVLNGTNGFQVVDAAGNPIVHFPLSADGQNTFQGDLVAQGFTAEGRSQFRGLENEISTASSFTLANGVTAPANAPRAEDWVDQVDPTGGAQFDAMYVPGGKSSGLWYESGKVSQLRASGSGNNTFPYYVDTMDLATGAVTRLLLQFSTIISAPHTEFSNPVQIAGLVKIGADWYTIQRRNWSFNGDVFQPRATWYVVRYNATTGVQSGAWSWEGHDQVPWTATFAGSPPNSNLPVLGVQGSELLVAQANASGVIRVQRFTPTTGALQGSVTLTGVTLTGTCLMTGNILHGSFDFGAPRYMVTPTVPVAGGDDMTAHVFNASTGAAIPAESWPWRLHAYDGLYMGLAWDGTRFVGGGLGDSVKRYGTYTGTDSWHVGFTWYDSTTAGSGTHETPLSPITTWQPKKRHGVKFLPIGTLPGNPEDDDDAPDTRRMYAARAAAYPGPGGMKLQPLQTIAFDVFGNIQYTYFATMLDAPANGSIAPTDNTFPDGNSAILESAVGGFIVRGDGTGAWPYLTDVIDDKLVEVDEALAEVQASAGGAPIGSEMSWPGPVETIPDGWYVEDGAQLLISSFPILYARLTNGGTVFPHGANTNGSGAAGTTHFRLPDRRSRTLVGRDATQVEFDTIGETGGAKTHTLTTAEMPSHSHGLTQAYTTPGGTGIAGIVYTATSSNTGPAGGGGPHNNLQPYAVSLWIIKATSGDQEAEPAPTYADLATTLRAKVATLTNITLSGLQAVDGYTLLEGDVVLVAGQTTAANNGVYVANAGAWARHPLADSTAKLIGMEVVIERGTAHGGKRFTPTGWKATDTLGTTAQVWKSAGLLMAPALKRLATEAVISSGTAVAISGLSHTFTVESAADTFAVDVVLDVRGSASAATQTLCIGDLYVDGAAVPGSVVSGGDGIIRTTAAQQWHLTGLAPGSHTVEVRAYRAGGTAINLHIASGHSSIEVTQLPTLVGDVAASRFRDAVAAATAGANVTLGSTNVYRRGGEGVGIFTFDLTINAATNPGATIATIPAGFRPVEAGQVLAYNLQTLGTVLLNVMTDGRLVPAWTPISAGHRLVGSATWALP